MERNLVIVAVLAAVWAFQASSAPAAPPPSAKGGAKAGGAQALGAGPAPGPEPVEGVGAALLRAHLHLADGAAVPALDDLRILVATLPDPDASHLDWAYDFHLDAVRRAFGRSGYVLEGFELPRSTAEENERPRPAGRPGALLFRPTAKGRPKWLVYVVTELATGGVDRKAFAAALAERSALLRTCADVSMPVVGPVFSGSSSSLREALVGVDCIVVSGSATSPNNPAVLGSAVRYSTTLHTDDALMSTLLDEVIPGLGISEDEVAVLQESTTDYGLAFQEAEGNGPGPLRIPFPMSIHSLRREVRADTTAATAQPSRLGRVLDTRVELDVYSERVRGEAPLLASKLSPPSIDLLLEEITRMLAQRRIRAALILASDVRDKLFLGRELKERLPDVQLVTTESNVLYLRPEMNPWLRGMLVASTYPLLLRDPAWLPQSGAPDQMMFASEGAEGTFNAVLVQIENPFAVTDYGPILAREPEQARPPVWVTTVGAGTMLPVLVHRPGGVPAETPLGIPHASGTAGPRGMDPWLLMLHCGAVLLIGSVIARQARRPRTGQFAVQMLRAPETRLPGRHRVQRRSLSVAEIARELRAFLRALRRKPGRATTSCADRSRKEEALERVSLALHHDLYWAFLFAAVLCVLLPPLAIGVLNGTGLLGLAFGTLAVGLAVRATRDHTVSAWTLARRYFDLGIERARVQYAWGAEILLRLAVVTGGVLYLLVTLAWTLQIVVLRVRDEPAFLLFAHRALEVDQGVSPLVPLTLVGVVLVTWSCWHLARIRDLAERMPAEPLLAALACDGGSRPAPDVRGCLFRIVPRWEGYVLWIALAGSAVWLATRFGRTLDALVLARAFDLDLHRGLLAAGMLGALCGSVWGAFRLAIVWSTFTQLLRACDHVLALLPFQALRTDLGVRADLALWPGSHSRELVDLARSRWERLAAIADDAKDDPLLDADDLRACAARCRESRQRNDPAALAFLNEVAELVRERAVRPPGKLAGAAKARVQALEELLSLEILLYVEWVVRHMRQLSLFLLLALVSTTFLVSSYPYQPQALLQTLSTVVFGGIVLCLVALVAAMSRNAALSRMSSGEPGRVSWDRTLLTNLALYGLVPLLTLIGSRSDGLHKVLLDLLKPLADFLAKT